MNKLISLTAFAFGILALISVLAMIYAMVTTGGMAVLAFKMWSIIAALAALGLGIASHIMARQDQSPHMRTTRLAIGLGAFCLIAPYIIGALSFLTVINSAS